uniref:Uncharacterized protein n=1 Tax=Stomoxys calcitrans TaxID=35570 RepID=A0A1I8QAM9_STOCA
MAQETKTQKQGGPPPSTSTSEEISIKPVDEDIEEIEIPQNKTMLERMQIVLEKFAQTRMGQMALEGCDRVLKVLEETAKWGVPQDENDTKLERPLPWLFFIPLIVWIRVIRFWLTIGSLMVGGPPITPQNMVYNIQVKRRRLRAIRVPALRAARRLETQSTRKSETTMTGKNKSLTGKISSLFGSAVCKPGQSCDSPARRAFEKDNISKVPDDNSTERTAGKRPRDDENRDLNMTVEQMLDKYANEDSDDDSDYVPNDKDDESDDTSSLSSSDSISSTEQAEMADACDNAMAAKQKEHLNTSAQNSSKLDNSSSMDRSLVEVKENGGQKHRPMPKPISEIKVEVTSDADSGSERIKTPGGPMTSTNGPKTTNNTEVAKVQASTEQHPKEPLTTPRQQQLPPPKVFGLSVAPEMEIKQKSTPGHESAATMKPSSATGVKTAAAPLPSPPCPSPKASGSPTFREKHYRTITTQTSVAEYDWSIIVKTEISHRKTPPVQVPKSDCSPPLTPASSTEDVFYSPIAHSTPKNAADHSDASTPESMDTRKLPNKPQQPQHHHNQYQQHHYNNKNRNKNRR